MPLRAGRVLADRFTLLRRLGAGSTGAVWLAEDKNQNRFACKILEPHLHFALKRKTQLAKEAEVLQRLRHPNITRPIELCTDDAYVFLVMELAEGQPLEAVMAEQHAQGTGFRWSFVRAMFGPLCEAVGYAHARGIIHRDLKPSNVMVADADEGAPELKVLDFGLARLLESHPSDATTYGRQMGSLFYMSPEQTVGAPATERSDIFALGTILFELVTLRRAWAHDEFGRLLPAFTGLVPSAANLPAAVSLRLASAPRPQARPFRAGVPVALEAVLASAMAIDPADRPASADELRRLALEALAATEDEALLSELTVDTVRIAADKPRVPSTAAYETPREPDPQHALPMSEATIALPTERLGPAGGHRFTLDRPEFWIVAAIIAALVGAGLGSLLAFDAPTSRRIDVVPAPISGADS